MFSKIYFKNYSKLTSTMYKLFIISKRIDLEKNGISWFFLVVNSRIDQVLNFLKILKVMGYNFRQKRIIGSLKYKYSNSLLNFKGNYLNITLVNIESFIDFFSFYYTKYNTLSYNLKTACFIYQNVFFLFSNINDFKIFRKDIVESLKMNTYTNMLLFIFRQVYYKFSFFLNKYLFTFFSQLFNYVLKFSK